ncbi:MAG: hypothetical protein HY052_03865 [Proteobacteria bacterium]|nr:hypothetical protein [Pseudomonadota bacterium]
MMSDSAIRFGIFMSDDRTLRMLALLAIAFVFITAAVGVNAGTTGTEFTSVYDKIKDWTTGYLGKTLAITSFLIGLGAGAFKGSPMPAIAGLGIALFSQYGVPVLEGISSAMIP